MTKCQDHQNLVVEPNTLVPSAEAQQFVVELDKVHNELKENISQAQQCYQKYVDQLAEIYLRSFSGMVTAQ